MTRSSIDQVLKARTPGLMAIQGVVGTGQGEQDGAPCILVFVRAKTPELERSVPDSLDGYPVRIEEVGDVKARDR